jgi:hypothetical protein
MSKVLKLDEMLEAARVSKMPQAERFVTKAEAVADELAVALANHLGVTTIGATFEGMAFAGLCANFNPIKTGDKCPDVLDEQDPDGDWE